MLLNESALLLTLFQQCCSVLMEQQRLFTVVGKIGENNIDKTSMFAIVIIVAQPCSNKLNTTLFTGCSTTLFTGCSTTLFTGCSITLFTGCSIILFTGCSTTLFTG